MEVENEQKRDRHLYFIGLDAVMPGKLMSQLSRGERVGMIEQEQRREKNEGGGKKKG